MISNQSPSAFFTFSVPSYSLTVNAPLAAPFVDLLPAAIPQTSITGLAASSMTLSFRLGGRRPSYLVADDHNMVMIVFGVGFRRSLDPGPVRSLLNLLFACPTISNPDYHDGLLSGRVFHPLLTIRYQGSVSGHGAAYRAHSGNSEPY